MDASGNRQSLKIIFLIHNIRRPSIVLLMKIRQPVFLLVLALIMVYATFYAPGSNTENFALIQRMYSSEFRSVNPLTFSVFNLLGVWPMVYAVLVLEEAESQTFPVWPFILLSFFMGGFIYLVYFGLRKPSHVLRPQTKLQKRVETRKNMILLSLVGLLLVLYGLVYGDWTGYIASFQTNGLVHIMSLDFILISLLFPMLVKDDMIRRDNYNLLDWAIYSFIPVLSALYYLNRRLDK